MARDSDATGMYTSHAVEYEYVRFALDFSKGFHKNWSFAEGQQTRNVWEWSWHLVSNYFDWFQFWKAQHNDSRLRHLALDAHIHTSYEPDRVNIQGAIIDNLRHQPFLQRDCGGRGQIPIVQML